VARSGPIELVRVDEIEDGLRGLRVPATVVFATVSVGFDLARRANAMMAVLRMRD
jgi:hypothetical protein